MFTLLICGAVFVAVSALIGLVAFALRDNGPGTAERLDTIVGKRQKSDASTEILKKTAFESDKRSLLEAVTPNLPSLQKVFEQADCHIKPSTLMAVAMMLAVMGATASWLARVPWIFAPLVGLIMFTIPFM